MTEIRTAPVDVERIDDAGRTADLDVLVVEEPLEIRIGERAIAVTMRTPGDDFDLVRGFLTTEGIASAGEIESLRHWGSPNVVRVTLKDAVSVDFSRLQRNFFAASSCGICGKASIDAIRVLSQPTAPGLAVRGALVGRLPRLLEQEQKTFAVTGGLHAAALADARGTILAIREDIGRHNAVDKVFGAMFGKGSPAFSDSILVVSGRAGFEVVQKAAVIGIPLIVAVGAPSSLAVELAREMNITIAGFVRDGRFNVYSAPGRIVE